MCTSVKGREECLRLIRERVPERVPEGYLWLKLDCVKMYPSVPWMVCMEEAVNQVYGLDPKELQKAIGVPESKEGEPNLDFVDLTRKLYEYVCGRQFILSPAGVVYQTDNMCAIGVSASEDSAEIYVSALERAVVDILNAFHKQAVLVWLRRADDALVLVREDVIDTLVCMLNHTNACSPVVGGHMYNEVHNAAGFNTKFRVHVCRPDDPDCGAPTAALEYKVEAKGLTVPMLDFWVSTDPTTRATTTDVYRKPCDGAMRSHHASDAPVAYRVAGLKAYVARAVTVCGTGDARDQEIQTVRERAKTDLASPTRVGSVIESSLKRHAWKKHMVACTSAPQLAVCVKVGDDECATHRVHLYRKCDRGAVVRSGPLYLMNVPWSDLQPLARAGDPLPEPWLDPDVATVENVWCPLQDVPPVPKDDADDQSTVPTVVLPWLGPHFDNQIQKLRKRGVGPRVVFSTMNLEKTFPKGYAKFSKAADRVTAGVYAFKCTCGAIYVGMTERTCAERWEEHKPCIKHPLRKSSEANAMARHLADLPVRDRASHDWLKQAPVLVARSKGRSVTRVLESFYAHALPTAQCANAVFEVAGADVPRAQRLARVDPGWRVALHRFLAVWPTRVFDQD